MMPDKSGYYYTLVVDNVVAQSFGCVPFDILGTGRTDFLVNLGK
ncbi:MAG: hypothetical protein WBB67_00465 [bacterium]